MRWEDITCVLKDCVLEENFYTNSQYFVDEARVFHYGGCFKAGRPARKSLSWDNVVVSTLCPNCTDNQEEAFQLISFLVRTLQEKQTLHLARLLHESVYYLVRYLTYQQDDLMPSRKGRRIPYLIGKLNELLALSDTTAVQDEVEDGEVRDSEVAYQIRLCDLQEMPDQYYPEQMGRVLLHSYFYADDEGVVLTSSVKTADSLKVSTERKVDVSKGSLDLDTLQALRKDGLDFKDALQVCIAL